MPGRRPRSSGRHDELLPLLIARARRRDRSGGGGMRTLALILLVLAVGGAAAAAGIAVAAGSAVQKALTDCRLHGQVRRPLPRTSFVFAANGSYLGAVRAEVYRVPVDFAHVSRWVDRATVAAEDRTFWTNDGLDYGGIARAALVNVAAGHVVEGASTITQQLVRNMYLSDVRTLDRKQREACLALRLAREWSKKKVLLAYLNRIPYGHRALGIEAAAQTYFGLHASQLGPVKAALLAGLPQAPSRYDPFVHPDAALRRRNVVLRAMAATHALTRAQLRDALAQPLGLHPGYAYTIRRDPQFFSYVEAQLVQAYGRARVRDGGLRVYTTLDRRAQAQATRAVRRNLNRKGDPAAAVVSINPFNGAIVAMASLVHGRQLQFNLAAQGARQTGSSFKPFVLIAAIWKKHADPDRSVYVSAPFTYQPTAQSKPWSPHTYENAFFGPETLTKAMVLSDNVVYAKLTLDVGPRAVAHVAHVMGVKQPLKPVPSIGLGSNSVRPLLMASAYATMASEGVYRKPYAIAKVVLPNGKRDTSHHWGARKGKRVIPRGVAYAITRVLEANVDHGTGVSARLAGRHVAGKTGTTSNWTDAWFCGYTPRRATVVWVGYPHKELPMRDVHGIHVQGASFPASIWHDFMAATLHGRRPIDFRPASWPMHAWEGPRGAHGSSAPARKRKGN
ncbi:MAG TPA: transglycosylase domain-containing protein [Gaiellaceae bacterium]|nr:transglycosylase domain-containing protein [Gaiellaceae bacterium]